MITLDISKPIIIGLKLGTRKIGSAKATTVDTTTEKEYKGDTNDMVEFEVDYYKGKFKQGDIIYNGETDHIYIVIDHQVGKEYKVFLTEPFLGHYKVAKSVLQYGHHIGTIKLPTFHSESWDVLRKTWYDEYKARNRENKKNAKK